MQLCLSPAEFTLLAEILTNRECISQKCPPHLLTQVLERRLQLDYDELDQLREILLTRSRKTAELAGTEADPAGKQKMETEQALVSSMVDKVTEACAML